MLARTVRSGVVEAYHDGAVVAVSGGEVIAAWGDISHEFFYRSAVKPFQATVAVEQGAALAPEELAVASSSHGGHPVHLAIVRSLLAGAGLDETALRCPAAWPLSAEAAVRLRAAGHRRPRPLFHNCSGKHAAMLRACVASDWPTDSYLEPDHPLQRRIGETLEDVTGQSVAPVGVDGCGVPAFCGTVTGLARAFSRLSSESRFGAAASALARFAALGGDNLRLDGRLGAWWGGPVKVGAAGVIAVGRNGLGVAAKSRDGARPPAVVGLVEALRRLGALSPAMEDALAQVARPPVLGGGRLVGEVAPALDYGPEPGLG